MNTKEMIEVMQAYWYEQEYRIAPEPKKEGEWERYPIQTLNEGCKGAYDYELVHLSRVNAIPGFGGIDYQSPFDPKVVVRSMVPLMFEPCGVPLTAGHDDGCRPGIPVAAWFWKEGEK